MKPRKAPRTRLAMAIAAVAIPAAAAATLATASEDLALDFAKINSNMAAVVAETIRGSNVIKSLDYSIDPEVTDLARDSYQVNKKAVLENVHWAMGRIETESSMRLHFKRKAPDAQDESRVHGRKLDATLGGKMAVKGDTLAMLKLMTLDKARECSGELRREIEASPSGLEAISAKHHCAMYAAVASAADITVVENAMRKFVDDMRESLQVFVKGAGPSVEHANDKILREEGLKLIASAQEKLDTLAAVKFESRHDGFAMKVPAMHLMRGCKIKDLELIVREDFASVQGALAFKLSERLYDAYKPEIAHMLKGIEEGREFGLEHIAYHIRVDERLLGSPASQMASEAVMQLPVQLLQFASMER